MYTSSPEKRGPYNSYKTHAALPQTPRPQPQVFADDFMTNLNELTKCKEDIFYFFSTYLKIYETRPAYGIGYKPFVLWPRQREYVQALEEALQGKHGLVVEKCRDMGATLVALGWITWHWLFDQDFQALLGSLREDEVKLGSSHDSLFSKLRDFVENLPAWLLPEGLNQQQHLMSLSLANPATGNTITGSSCTENFGRSRRSTVILRDESAFWPFDTSGNTVHTSDTVLDISTVNGIGHFSELADKAEAQGHLFVLNWDDNPSHTLSWFNDKKKNSPAHIFAREVMRNRLAAVAGQIYPMINDIVPGDYDFNPEWDLDCFWDYGYSDDTYLGILQRDPATADLYLLSEVVHSGVAVDWFVPFVPGAFMPVNSYIYTQAELAKQMKHANWHGRVRHYGDPTGNQRTAATGKSVFDVLKPYNIRPKCKSGSQNMPYRQICATKALNRLHIDKSCEYFITSFSQYVIPRGQKMDEATTAKIKGVHKWSHAPSAFEYFAISEPPLEDTNRPKVQPVSNPWQYNNRSR